MSTTVMPNYVQPFQTAIPGSQQVVIPQITIPQPPAYNMMPAMQAMPAQGVQPYRVKGLDEAKAFQTQANSTYALFVEDDDVFYWKVTDQNNYPTTLKRYRFVEEEEPVLPPEPQYATIEQFQALSDRVEEAVRKLEEVLN